MNAAWFGPIVIVLGFLAYIALRRFETSAIENLMRDVATRTNLSHSSSFRSQYLRGNYRNRHVEIEIAKVIVRQIGDGRYDRCVKIRTRLKEKSEIELFITASKLADWRNYPKDSRVFQSTDSNFENLLTTRSNSEEFAGWLLGSAALRNKLLQAHPDFVALQSQLVYLENRYTFNSSDELLFLTDLICELANKAEGYAQMS